MATGTAPLLSGKLRSMPWSKRSSRSNGIERCVGIAARETKCADVRLPEASQSDTEFHGVHAEFHEVLMGASRP